MSEERYRSLKWTITLGTMPGYGETKQDRIPKDKFVDLFRDIALIVEKDTGIYISCVFYDSVTVYKTEWGCTEEGELTYTLTGSCNRAFTDTDGYLEALKLLARKLKERLNQSTILLEIMPMEEFYFKD